jgi:hypothetical protein
MSNESLLTKDVEKQQFIGDEVKIRSCNEILNDAFEKDKKLPRDLERRSDQIMYFLLNISWDMLELYLAGFLIYHRPFAPEKQPALFPSQVFVDKHYTTGLLYLARLVLVLGGVRCIVHVSWFVMSLCFSLPLVIVLMRLLHDLRFYMAYVFYLWLTSGALLILLVYTLLNMSTCAEFMMLLARYMWNIDQIPRSPLS